MYVAKKQHLGHKQYPVKFIAICPIYKIF